MTDNIRTTPPATFMSQDWQQSKIRATPGTATVDEIRHKVTAEWANAVDEAQREINNGFFGFPVQAVNTRGWVRGSNQAQTSGVATEHIKTILLVKNVMDEEFLELDVFIAARAIAGSGSWSRHEIALFRLTGGAFARQATELSVEQALPAGAPWLTGADVVFPDIDGSSNLAMTVTGPTSGESVVWTVDFSVRAGPSGLPDTSIIGTQ